MEHIKKFNENEHGNPGITSDKDKVVDMFISELDSGDDINFYLCVKTQKGKNYYIDATIFSPFDFRNDDFDD